MLTTEDPLRAPSIWLRLWAKRARVAMFVVCAAIIGYLSWETTESNWGEIIFWSWALVNVAAWGWETVYVIRRYLALVVTSELKVQKRYRTRVVIFWFVVVANFGLMLSIGNSTLNQGGIIALLVVIYNLFTLAWLAYDALRWFRWPKIERWFWATTVFWTIVAISFGLVAFISLQNTVTNTRVVWGVSGMTTAIAFIVFIMQRLEVEDHVHASVIRDLINNILGVPQTNKQWDGIVELIGDRLRYKRVYILEPSMEEGRLRIAGQHGEGPNFVGKDIPIDLGITGRSFRTGEILAWNDIRKCEYYYNFLDKSQDDTRAEIAIPIHYLGIPYGVLDIQDTQTGVFSRQDIRSLEVIARILGAALSAQKSDLLVDDAYNLWEELSKESYSEEDIFREFAKFAMRKLGADIVGYYPLSPAGYPISAPFIEGKLNNPERMKNPISRPDSLLFKLIREWRPQFIEIVKENLLFSSYDDTRPSHFSVREGVKSVCFLPIGTPKERLGAMFLNFRQARKFDGLFKFMVLNFSQTFAMLAIRNRYRAILIEGYGRPELGIHNLFSRYGLKTGVVDEGAKIFENSCRQFEQRDFSKCGMLELLNRVDGFLDAANIVDASIPPLFWRQSILSEVENYASALPPSRQRGPKPSTIIDMDPQIEREGSWAKLAVYRVITESMNNAVFHGATKEVIVKAQRRPRSIWVQIINDGNPLDDSAKVKKSRRGIFSILKELEERFRAETKIEKGYDGTGTIVEVSIPVIPLNHEV
ncbi:MAG: GAF domain-containing protein [Anaerolineales bacterium]|nr:GAF domain-containing protein [Anaerolineales bacterium]